MTPLEVVKEKKIIAIVRGLPPRHMLHLGHALEEGGVCMM